jgi:hypothetical protein
MCAQVATFAGWPMPSQIARSQTIKNMKYRTFGSREKNLIANLHFAQSERLAIYIFPSKYTK